MRTLLVAFLNLLLLSFHMFHTSHNHDSPGSHIACGPPVKLSLCMLCDPTFWIYVYEAATTKHQTHDHFESQASEKNPWWSFWTIPSWPVMNSRNCWITYSLFIPCIIPTMLLILEVLLTFLHNHNHILDTHWAVCHPSTSFLLVRDGAWVQVEMHYFHWHWLGFTSTQVLKSAHTRMQLLHFSGRPPPSKEATSPV